MKLRDMQEAVSIALSGNTQQARAWFRDTFARAASPAESAALLIEFVLQLVESGRLDDADQVLEQLQASAAAPSLKLPIQYCRSMLKEANRDLYGALALLLQIEDVLNSHLRPALPEDFDAEFYIRLGSLYLDLQDPPNAIQKLERAPRTPMALYLLGTCYLDLKDVEKAAALLGQALEGATEERIRLLAGYQLGVVEYKRKHYEEAYRQLTRCESLLGTGALSPGLIYEALAATARALNNPAAERKYMALLSITVKF